MTCLNISNLCDNCTNFAVSCPQFSAALFSWRIIVGGSRSSHLSILSVLDPKHVIKSHSLRPATTKEAWRTTTTEKPASSQLRLVLWGHHISSPPCIKGLLASTAGPSQYNHVQHLKRLGFFIGAILLYNCTILLLRLTSPNSHFLPIFAHHFIAKMGNFSSPLRQRFFHLNL